MGRLSYKLWILILISTHHSTLCSELTESLSEVESTACEGQELYLQCPFGTYIFITHAEFGRQLPSSILCPYKHLPEYMNKPFNARDESKGCSASNAMEKVESLCQERRVCSVKATVRRFSPDPCPGTGKYLKVTYKCIPTTKRTETICEGKTLNLECDKGKRLFISSAQYGYDDLIPQMCSRPSTLPANQNIGCLSSSAESLVKEECHNRRSCSINADEPTFSNLCPGIGKYLKVTFICVPKNIIRSDGTVPIEDLPQQISDSKAVAGASTSVDEDCNCTAPADHSHSQKDPSLVFSWVHSTNYIQDNQEKLILYGMLCGCLAFICALIVFIARMFYVRYKKTKRSATHQKLNVTEPAIQDTSNEENTYIAAGDPSDMAMIQYNLAYNRGNEATNRLGSGPSSYRGSSNTRVFNNDPETQRFNTNSLTVTNPLHNPHLAEHHRNFNNSPLTTVSTAMNNSPNTALSENRNTYYENSGDDEHTNDDNSAVRTSQMLYNNRPGTSSTGGPGPDVRPRTNSLFDRHS